MLRGIDHSIVFGIIFTINNQILLVLYRCLNHFAHDRPKIICKFIVIFRCQISIAASNQSHFQLIDRKIWVFVFLKHLLRQKRFPRMGCTRYQYDYNLSFSSFFTFSKSLQVSMGIRLLISSILLSHHLNLSNRSINSSSKRFLSTVAGLPTTIV